MTRKYIKKDTDNPMIEPVKRLTPPKSLSVASKKIFRRLVAAMPSCHFESGDIDQLINYADITAEIEECKEDIKLAGRWQSDAKGLLKAHPAVATLNSLRTASASLATKLQLNPRARGSGLTKAAQRKKATAHDKVERSEKRSADLMFIPGGKRG